MIGVIVQGNDFDVLALSNNINMQERYNMNFPRSLQGSIGFQRCSSLYKRTFPVWWPSKHGITTYAAKDLISCNK